MKKIKNILDIPYKKEFLFSNLATAGNDIQLLRIAHETWGPELFLTRTGMTNQIILYILKGEGIITIDGNKSELSAGMVFAAGHGHHIEISTDGQKMEIFIVAGDWKLKQWFLDILGANGFAYKLRNSLEIQHLFEAMLHEMELSNPYTHDICLNYLHILLRKVALNRIHGKRQVVQALQTFNKCRQFIDRNYKTLQSSNEIAGKCNLVTAYLCRLFKKYENCSPGHYLIRLKLNHANNQLLGTQKTVKTISEELNFDSPYTFSRAYKKHMGIAPLHYRQKHTVE